MNAWTNVTVTVGRILIALLFVRAGIVKLGSIDATAAEMGKAEIPFSNILILGSIAMELSGGLLVMAGLFTGGTRLVSLYTNASVVLPCLLGSAGCPNESANCILFEHVSMMGGMLVLVAFGAGAYSLDGLIRRKT